MNQVQRLIEEIYAYSLHGIKLGLENITKLTDALGKPQESYKIIHIAGTNGKGSTAAMLEALLSEAGHKTAKYTSPHLVKFNERFRIDNQDITDQRLVELYLTVKEAIARTGITPTFFEVTTVMMFLYTKEESVEYLVLETGLGGLWDATNIVTPIVSLITNISFDHQAYLGNTLLEIAKEKAGIIKPNIPVFFADDKPELIHAIKEKTVQSVNVLEKTYTVSLDYENFLTEVGIDQTKFTLSLFGIHQVKNFLLVHAVSRLLSISDQTLKKAMLHLHNPGRFEIINRHPMVICDGAHNIDSARTLKEMLSHYKKRGSSTYCLYSK